MNAGKIFTQKLWEKPKSSEKCLWPIYFLLTLSLVRSCQYNMRNYKNLLGIFLCFLPLLCIQGKRDDTFQYNKYNTINTNFYSFQIVLPNLLQNIEHLWSKLLAFQWMKQLLWCWFHMAVPFGPKSKELLALKIKPIMPALGLECYVKTK